MDEKTEELRDIFMSVSDDASVTESQDETHGSLVGDGDVEARLAEIVADMREAVGFETSLTDGELVTVVRGFYEGETDAAIAARLADADPETVAEARLDLHLLRDADEGAPIPLEEVRAALADASVEAAAADLGLEADAVDWYRRVLATREEIRRVNDRYRDAFEDLLADRGLAERMTRDAQQTGLAGSLEGQETDTQL
ncbi:MAG: conditioned medium-induced protein 4 [Halanaeroarchaeum sp.]